MAKSVYDFDPNMRSHFSDAPKLIYFDVKDSSRFGLYGISESAAKEDSFCRFTSAQRDYLKKVSDGEAWNSTHSAGVQIKFMTDATDIFVKVGIKSKFDMTNMTQIGQVGCDLYVYMPERSEFVFHAAAHPKFDETFYEERLGDFRHLGKSMRRFIINLPLYMETCTFSVGINDWANVQPDAFSCSEKIAVYGTSITHGCCASRPGMAYTNILSRRLDTEFLNFGFSGTAMMEKEVAVILNDFSFDMLIVDTEPNAGVSDNLFNNLESFLDIIFSKTPDLPVLLLSRMLFALDYFDMDRVALNKKYIGFMSRVARRYRKMGRYVYFYDQSNALGKNFAEYTVDGVHPTDIAMVMIADFYEKKIAGVRKLVSGDIKK